MTIFRSRDTVDIPNKLTLVDFILHTHNPVNPCLKNWGLPAFIDSESGECITHDQIRSFIPQIASGLANKYGLKKGDTVLIFSPNHINYALLLLSAVELGLTVTTTNPNYTVTELKHQLKDSAPKVVFTTLENAKVAFTAISEVNSEIKLATIDSQSINFENRKLEGLNELRSNLPYEKLKFKEEGESKKTPCLIVYSSGTTGLPKGVMLSHYNIIANIIQSELLSKGMQVTGLVTGGVLPYYHCYGIISCLMHTVHNHFITITIPKFNFIQFLKLIEKYRIEGLYLAPPIILGLAKSPEVNKYDLSSLKTIVSGAAPLSYETAKEAVKRLGVKMFQGYGMSELTPITSLLPYGSDKFNSVGILCPNVEVKIVCTETGNLLPAGKAGEIWVRGPNVMMGYLNNPKATNETINSEGYLRTGDIGYFDDEEFLFISDRIKELIKHKGHQIAPAELENILLSHPLVADACVIGIPHESAGELPKAYIVLNHKDQSKYEEHINDIRKHTHSKVTKYKYLSGGIEVISEIPKSPAGKVLRRVLKEYHLENSKKDNKL